MPKPCDVHCGPILRHIAQAVSVLMGEPALHSVTVFCDPLSEPKQRVRVTRRKYKAFKGYPKNQPFEVMVSIGRPNYAEREHLKQCKKAGCKTQRWLGKMLPERKGK